MRKTTKLVALFAAALSGATALTGCGGSSSGGSSATKDTLRIAVLSPVTTFDPTKIDCGSGRFFCQTAYDALLHPAADGSMEPGMATSFTYDKSATKLTLKLREGITFTDGTPFDANVAKKNMDFFIKAGGPTVSQADSIRSVSAPDADTLVIDLETPDPGLLVSLSENLGMMAEPTALAAGKLGKAPVGSGPYVYNADKSQTGSAVFDRNENYWDKASYPFDHVKLIQLSDPNTILNAIKVGQIDAAGAVAKQLDGFVSAGFKIRESAGNWNGLIIADRAGKTLPPLGKVEVRQAINLAVDRDLFTTELVPNGSTWTDQIFAPGGPAYDEALNDRYRRDIAKAKQLMADAGYAEGFSVTMPDLSQFVGGPSLNTAMIQQLGEIGIKVIWKKVPIIELIGALQQGKYPMFFFALSTSTPWKDLQTSVLPNATFNPFKSEDPALNKLLSQAKNAAPGATQDKAYKAINTFLVDNAWFVPMFTSTSAWATVDSVSIDPQTFGIDLVRFKPTGK